ncbi:hypothetical protein SS1G_06389 [Sclerotinia sclerotiorum 1980 UF-70]|uniref:SGNH hydrolase-type esterase domain-containing protein n=1 Tax=Sclerotinia sclerotiorum (strain ATCC 18683 / 1980 / Ss-1) TaxID=665079 RepID=A7EM42_SCLS1|nr:hypothetical protein SS1G_06389 [Sclerotinia sclerotiorum 1980 UF-70]EDO03908.1 hypothetical protein SS1G_06389 [Sclerotinia sclerotiorum 1980 UF-70]
MAGITQGSNEPNGFSFASALQNAYARKLDVINRGFSAYNTNHALEVLPQFLPTPSQAKIRFLLIFFGANDLNRGPSANQYVPLPQFIQNIRKLISHPLIQAHGPRIILVTPAPVDEATCRVTNGEWGYSDDPRRVRDTREYRDEVVRIGEEHELGIVDLWTAFMGACGWKEGDDPAKMPGLEENGRDPNLTKLLYDGLHFSGEAYKILFEEVLKCIVEKFPDQAPDKLENVFKAQWEIDMGR